MCQKKTAVVMGFTKEEYPAGTHMCLIYSNEYERRKIISKFLEGGYANGERVSYFADSVSVDEVQSWLNQQGVDIPERDLTSCFQILDAEEIYCPGMMFEPEKMLGTLRQFYDESCEMGYPNCRVSGEMTWALKKIPGSDRLMEYESLVNRVLETHPVTAVCQYDATRFDGATILQCLEVHPYMIVHGQIVHNPYYLDTEMYMKKYLNKAVS